MKTMTFIPALIVLFFVTMMTISFRNIITKEHVATRKIQTCAQRGGEVRYDKNIIAFCSK